MTSSLKVALCAILMVGSVTTGFANEALSYREQAKELIFAAGSKVASTGSHVLSKGADAAQWTSSHASNAYKVTLDKVSTMGQSASAYWTKALKAASSAIVSGCQKASDSAVAGFNWAVDKTPEGAKEFVVNHPYITGAAIATPIAIFIGYKIAKARQVKPDVQVKVEEPMCQKPQQPVLVLKLKPAPNKV